MSTNPITGWCCQRCSAKFGGNPRFCPRCGYTVYAPLFGDWAEQASGNTP